MFTWKGPKNLTHFVDDISPLVRRVAFYGGPNVTDYLGVVQFGTEEFHTANGANVTFTAEKVSMSAVKGVAPVDQNIATTRRTCIPLLTILSGVVIFVLIRS